jgi:hypothetical protein
VHRLVLLIDIPSEERQPVLYASSERTRLARLGGSGSDSSLCSQSGVCTAVMANHRGGNMAPVPDAKRAGQSEPVHRCPGARSDSVHTSSMTQAARCIVPARWQDHGRHVRVLRLGVPCVVHFRASSLLFTSCRSTSANTPSGRSQDICIVSCNSLLCRPQHFSHQRLRSSRLSS